jgi:putative transposase
MTRNSITATALPPATVSPVGKALEEVAASFDRFCLAAGIEALGEMMERDAAEVCGPRHSRAESRRGYRWGRTQGKIGFHGGKTAIERPRARDFDGRELALPIWEQAVADDWLGKWAMNLMLINVSTRKFRRAVRLPEGDVPALAGAGVSKSAASRHFVALSAARLQEWLATDLSGLDLLVVQIDGIHLLEGLDEILTVARLGLPRELRRSLACTNIIENMMGTIRRVSRNVKHWGSASMALRWTAAAMLEAKKGFRRLKAYKQLKTLRAALIAHYERASNKSNDRVLDQQLKVA